MYETGWMAFNIKRWTFTGTTPAWAQEGASCIACLITKMILAENKASKITDLLFEEDSHFYIFFCDIYLWDIFADSNRC